MLSAMPALRNLLPDEAHHVVPQCWTVCSGSNFESLSNVTATLTIKKVVQTLVKTHRGILWCLGYSLRERPGLDREECEGFGLDMQSLSPKIIVD